MWWNEDVGSEKEKEFLEKYLQNKDYMNYQAYKNKKLRQESSNRSQNRKQRINLEEYWK